jgi:hypothetical protein
MDLQSFENRHVVLAAGDQWGNGWDLPTERHGAAAHPEAL